MCVQSGPYCSVVNPALPVYGNKQGARRSGRGAKTRLVLL